MINFRISLLSEIKYFKGVWFFLIIHEMDIKKDENKKITIP